MNGLRWTIGIVTALAGAGWVALAVGGSRFRQSFGASANPALMTLLPIVAAALVIASVAFPERRLLLHLVAALMAVLIMGCAVIARETLFVATVGALYAGLWFLFYYHTVRS
jgi:hypothetical protein